MTRTSLKILVDTSAWVELFRRTGSQVHTELSKLMQTRAAVAVTEPVVMELLSAGRPIDELAHLRAQLLRLRMLRIGGLDTYERAASIHRACRAHGETVRSSIDCLIAAVAIRVGAPVLHNDRDFDVIARHTDLRIYPV